MMSERTFKPVDAYVEAAPDEGLIVLCRLGAPNLPRNDYYIAEHDEVTIYPGHEERLTEAEWLERSKPQVDAKLIERAREAIDRWVRGGVEGMADGARLFLALGDLLAAVEAGEWVTREQCWQELREAIERMRK
ncbi:MAG: hypothetical protein GX936_10765 [Clostridiales bacterium]|nr:hypothetical protein [Clostridiales bacterium]